MDATEYTQMMASALRAVKAGHEAGKDMKDSLRIWQAANTLLSKAEQRLIVNRVVPRVINRARDRKAA